MNMHSKTSSPIKIILFLCNWGAHAAYQTLQDEQRTIPDEVHMVRIPCTGRIDRALLLKAFAMGADGVALLGCDPGTCRYGTGTATAQRNTADTVRILDLMGLGSDRLRFASFLPDESDKLLNFLSTFHQDLQQKGHTGILPANGARAERNRPLPLIAAPRLQELAAKHDIHACQDCGKCSSACPLALIGKPFSARGIANAVTAGNLNDPTVRENVWSCLTCGLCHERCPSAVNFPAFIQELRALYTQEKQHGEETHGGFLHALMRSMASPDLSPRRWRQLPGELQVDQQSKTLFYGGCAPYYDIFFNKHLDVQTEKILFDAIRLLNFFDVRPRLLEDERCCGHDLLWSGDREYFDRIARLNVERLNGLGIETLITSCPECYTTFHTTYPQHGLELNFQVVHLYDYLEKEIDRSAVSFQPLSKHFTFQDSCRLTRLENRPELPRLLLERLGSATFTEVSDSGKAAMCCGNSAWTGCDAYSKAMQVKRLEQVQATGADLLVTACPKCQIHLKCAMEDPLRLNDLTIEMQDLTSVLAQSIRWK